MERRRAHLLWNWELETGRARATLEGHTDGVTACAVTPDGRHVVSASLDQTLKLWDLETHACLVTHRGDAPYLAVAATTTVIVAGESGGGVWFLDLPPPHRSALAPGVREGEPDKLSSHAGHAITPSRPRINKHTILFLAANPTGTDPRALDREARAIQAELERSGHRDRFELVTRWAVEPLDLLRELRKLKPTVVHFSGHGAQHPPGDQRPAQAQRRDLAGDTDHRGDEPRDGLYFQGPEGRAQLVSVNALQETRPEPSRSASTAAWANARRSRLPIGTAAPRSASRDCPTRIAPSSQSATVSTPKSSSLPGRLL